jgi:uncharacterized cupin superfamily protein
MGKKIDIAVLKPVAGTLYPPPFDEPCRLRERTRLGDAAGLTQYGVNLLRLPPGAWSSQRHWHAKEDEFIYVLSGEVVLATDAGEEMLRAATAPASRAAIPTGTASRTAARRTQWCWKLARASRANTRRILTST